jgi:hypothetical protein
MGDYEARCQTGRRTGLRGPAGSCAPGTLCITVPTEALDPEVTVVKIELDGPLNLYGGEGVEITVN